MEAGLPAMAALRCASQTAPSASQASQLPQVIHRQQNLRLARSLCGSGLARDGIAAQCLPDRAVCIAGKPAPTGNALPAESAACQEPLWKRACPRWQRCGVPARPRRPHRRQASSHRLFIANRICTLPGAFVGAGLPAMAAQRYASQIPAPTGLSPAAKYCAHPHPALRRWRSNAHQRCNAGCARRGRQFQNASGPR